MRLSAILPPGSWQLISENLLRPEVNTWYLAIFGWAGMLLVGSQVIKLIIKGIELIYGDASGDSFFRRQIRGVLLFSATSVVWFAAVAVSVFGSPLGRWITQGLGTISVGSRLLDDPPPDLGDDPTNTRPGLDLSVCGTRSNELEIRPAGSRGGNNSMVGPQFSVWGLRQKDAIQAVPGGLAAAIGLMVWMSTCEYSFFSGRPGTQRLLHRSMQTIVPKRVPRASVLALHQSDDSL